MSVIPLPRFPRGPLLPVRAWTIPAGQGRNAARRQPQPPFAVSESGREEKGIRLVSLEEGLEDLLGLRPEEHKTLMPMMRGLVAPRSVEPRIIRPIKVSSTHDDDLARAHPRQKL